MGQNLATAKWTSFPSRLVKVVIAPSAALLCVTVLGGCAGSSDNRVAAGFTANAAATDTGPSSAEDRAATAALSKIADRVSVGATPGQSGYRIGPRDLLNIEVFKAPDLTRTVQVAETGTINLPLVGEIPASGKTAQEIERDLTTRLGARYLQSPQVSVQVKEYNSQRVTVEGAAKKPGVYSIKEKNTLLDMMAQAGGIDREVASNDIVVFRRDDRGGRSAAVFDLDAIRAGTAQDPLMQPGDVIVVDTSNAKVALSTALKVLPAAAMFRPF